ncbi:MAG TPA: hypothetical protein PKM84_00960 [Candidatus Pacearchaeota archaeon]|nr:hypothetical protein [Candidatus Pacearchaeota archaeon]
MDLKNIKLNDYSKIIVFLLVIAAIFGIDYLVYKIKKAPQTENPAQVEIEEMAPIQEEIQDIDKGKELTLNEPLQKEQTIEMAGQGIYRNAAYGIELKYPSNIFKISETEGEIIFYSPYSFVGTFSGDMKDKFVHNFSVTFKIDKTDILEAIKKNIPFGYLSSFPGKTLQSFTKVDGFSSSYSLGGKSGYAFWEGAEGVMTQYVFAPKSDKETLVVKFKYIADSLKPKISQQEQNRIFGNMMGSFLFLK